MRLENKKIAVFLEEGFEDLEFWVPVMRLREEGAMVTVVGVEAGKKYKGKHGLTATSDVAAQDVGANDFDGVVVPGGWAPSALTRSDGSLDAVADPRREGEARVVGVSPREAPSGPR